MGNLTLLCVAVLVGVVIANNNLDLWIAAKRGNLADADNALAKGADPDVRNGDTTPVYWASMHGWIDIVTLLISHHADVNIPTKYGWTPLMMATVQGHMSVVKALINVQANVNLADSHGDTALHRAATWNKLDIAHLLLRNGADPRKKDNKGRTPSHVASEYGHHQLANIIDTFTTTSVNTTSVSTTLPTKAVPTNQPSINMSKALLTAATSTVPVVLLNIATATPDNVSDLPLLIKIIIGFVVTVSTAMILYLLIWYYKDHRRASQTAPDAQPVYMHFVNSDKDAGLILVHRTRTF